jgi:hypothetical protein
VFWFVIFQSYPSSSIVSSTSRVKEESLSLPFCDAFKAFIVQGLIVADEHTKIHPKTQEH